jgi:WD40 repeat protein
MHHPGAAESVRLGDHDRRLVVTGDDGTAAIWDRSDPARPRRVGTVATGLVGNRRSAQALSPDGNLYVIGRSIAAFTLWDITDPGQPRKLASVLTGRIGPVSSLGLSGDGSILAVGGADSSIAMWDVTDRANPRRFGADLFGTGIPVLGLAFLPDGKTLATQTIRTVDVWDVSMLGRVRAAAASLACERLDGQGLDAAGWRQYASTVEYRDTCG